jgi:anti-sigma regulatory factor (Ser/Thr protein kinase)
VEGFADMNIPAINREQQVFEAVPSSARRARRFVGEILRRFDASDDAIVDFELVVSELVTNFIEHGDGSPVYVLVDVNDLHCWELDVVGGAVVDGSSSVCAPLGWTIAAAEVASGRGLGIVRMLMDDVSATAIDGRLSVRCRRQRYR